jgi:hypothetical protein
MFKLCQFFPLPLYLVATGLRTIQHLSILSFETINKLKLFFKCGIPMPQDAGTPLLLLLQFFYLYIFSIAVLENVPLTQGYRKEPRFPH